MFDAFSGCDTTAFNVKGKKSVWQAHKDVTETSVFLAGHPFSATGCRRLSFPIALDNDCHPLCQNQSFELCFNETRGQDYKEKHKLDSKQISNSTC